MEGERTELRLRTARWARLGDALTGLLPALVGWALAGFFFGLALHPAAGGAHPTPFWRGVAGALGLLCVAMRVRGRGALLQSLRGGGRLMLDDDRLVLQARGVLSDDLTVDRAAVRAVAIDSYGPRGGHRFPVWRENGDADEVLTWAWDRRGSPQLFPLLGQDYQDPNVLILFEHPQDFPARRRRGLRRVVDPRPGKGEAGIAARVADPEAAARAFGEWGVLRPLHGEDIARARSVRRRAVTTA